MLQHITDYIHAALMEMQPPLGWRTRVRHKHVLPNGWVRALQTASGKVPQRSLHRAERAAIFVQETLT